MGFFSEKNIFGSKIRNSRQKNPKISTVEIPTVLNRDQPTHNEWGATARMSSETAPVSEPVYGYWVDKRVPAAVDES